MALMKLALPNAYNFPTASLKHTRDDFVARHIVIEFALPKFETAFRRIRELAALMSMPEAPIHENGNLIAGENKIRFAKHTRISSPAPNCMLPKKRDHAQLRVAIPFASDSGHHRAARS
jgi:hypothetical protein